MNLKDLKDEIRFFLTFNKPTIIVMWALWLCVFTSKFYPVWSIVFLVVTGGVLVLSTIISSKKRH